MISLEEEGISHRPVPIDGTTRESFVVLEESTGRVYVQGTPEFRQDFVRIASANAVVATREV